MSCRYLALVNFSCLGSELKAVIKTIVGSCCTVLQYYLRRSLCQLIDLGSSVSGIVIRLLENLLFIYLFNFCLTKCLWNVKKKYYKIMVIDS